MQPEKPNLVGSVDLGTVQVPYKVPCIDPSKLPPRPVTHMPDNSADINAKASGAGADIEELNKYADSLEAAMAGCYSSEGVGP